jgi:hypothetical protein
MTPAIDPRWLAACPFCGGGAELRVEHDHVWVSHNGCPVDLGAFEGSEDAIAAWNRRSASSPPLPADVERLLSRLRERAANMNGAMKSGGLYLRLGDYADEDAALDRQAAALITALCEEIRKLKEGRE